MCIRDSVYTNGRIASGSILDRNGTVLFDCAEGNYSDDKTTRISTLHAIGDKQGNINTGAKNLFADQLVGFSLITGTSGTGNSINLTLDANLNNAAYQAMAGRKGVVALYNYQTGEVLCMLSTPSVSYTHLTPRRRPCRAARRSRRRKT